MATIDADKLLEWLRDMRNTARQERDRTEIDMAQKHYWGYVCALSEVIAHIRYETYLADKPADTEEE